MNGNAGATPLMRFWLSPVGCALISYALFLIAWAMPADLYASLVHEPDLMQFSFRLWLFVTGCVLAFLIGTWAARKVGGAKSYSPLAPPLNTSFSGIIIGVLIASAALNLFSLSQIIHQSGDILGMIRTGGGAAAKATLNTEGALTEALPLSYGLVWWAMARRDQLAKTNAAAWHAVGIVILVAIGASAITATLKIARFELIPFVVGLFIIAQRQQILSQRVRYWQVVVAIIGVPALILAIFFAFSAIRGMSGFERQMTAFMGYGPASYNRLQAVLNGQIGFVYGGHWLYTFGFLGRVPLLHTIVPLDRILGIPPWSAAFLSEFKQVANSGLQGQFIWPTAFGYIFADLKWATFLYMAGLGFMIEKAWASWNRGGVFGLVMYPYMAATVLLWGSSNLIVMPRFVTLAGASLALMVVEGALRPQAPKRYLHPARVSSAG